MKTVLNIDAIKDGSIGLDKLSEDIQSQLEKINEIEIKVTWDANSNMNDFKTPGVYEIYGERTVDTDNLPIINDGSGHSISARLTVVASTLQPANNEICVTQFLQLSNRIGGEGTTYVRTYNENNNDMNGWSPWQKYIGMVETYMNGDNYGFGFGKESDGVDSGVGLSYFIDNGIYSGVYVDDNYILDQSNTPSFMETFVLIVINDYAASGKLNLPRHITQLKYAVDAITGQSTVKKRVGTGNGVISWGDWEDIGGSEVDTAIAEIKSRAVDADSLNVEQEIDSVRIDFATLDDGMHSGDITIPMATTEKAGVMSAEDKIALDNISTEIDKIKDGDTIVGYTTITDNFLIRTTASSGTIGDGVASLKSVGGNIVKNLVDGTFESGWIQKMGNELIDRGQITKVTPPNAWGGISCTIKTVVGHTYYGNVWLYSTQNVYSFYNNLSITTGNSIKDKWGYSSIYASANEAEVILSITTMSTPGVFYCTKPIVIDLTEMFGAGNEPTKEECDRMFGTMDALPQGLSIAKPTEFKSTGFNQFKPNNVLEGKAIVDNAIVSGDKKIAVIPCLPCKVGVGENNGYCIHGEFGEDIKVYLTPLNPMEVEGELSMHELTKDATTDTYVPLIKGYLLVEVPTTANLCAHFLWSEDKCVRDTYEPYFESKIELPTIPEMSEWGLAGIQTGGTLICDEINLERGVYIKRIDVGYIPSSIKYEEKYNYGSFALLVKFQPKDSTVNKAPHLIIPNLSTVDRSSFSAKDNVVSMNSGGRLVIIKDTSCTTTEMFKSKYQGLLYYSVLATPEEYPLPKVDNNYISSDYGVEQFDSVVPCNANNLYYISSLVGETRNFLDRLYYNTDKTNAKEVADYITNNLADKIPLATSENDGLMSAEDKENLDISPKILDSEESDFAIADDKGNIIVNFSGGEIQTKNFDSRLRNSSIKKHIKALFIGNSVNQDHITYLPWLLKSTYGDEIDFTICIFYIGSYTIAQYVDNVITGTKGADIWSVATNTSTWTNSSGLSLQDAIRYTDFDIISMQGYFNNSVESPGVMGPEDMSKFKNMIDFFKENAIKPFTLAFLMHQTYKSEEQGAWQRTLEGCTTALREYPVELLFPCGFATKYAMQLGVSQSQLTPDNIHNTEGLPCIMGSYVVLSVLSKYYSFSNKVTGNPNRVYANTNLNIPSANGSIQTLGEEVWDKCQTAAIQAVKAGEALCCTVNQEILNLLK